jgi:hypothetical protein
MSKRPLSFEDIMANKRAMTEMKTPNFSFGNSSAFPQASSSSSFSFLSSFPHASMSLDASSSSSSSITHDLPVVTPKLEKIISLDYTDGNHSDISMVYENHTIGLYDIKITANDGELYASKYMIRQSPVLNNLLNTYPTLEEINMIDFYKDDIKSWLLRWHSWLSNGKLTYRPNPPNNNIGSYMMLCHKYELNDLLKIAFKKVSKLNAEHNLDLISYMIDFDIFDEVLFHVSQWVLETLPKSFSETLPSKFILKCHTVFHKHYLSLIK